MSGGVVFLERVFKVAVLGVVVSSRVPCFAVSNSRYGDNLQLDKVLV